MNIGNQIVFRIYDKYRPIFRAKIRDSEVIPGRTDMQIRDRYYNALSPGHIRGPWTEEEDMLLREVRKHY